MTTYKLADLSYGRVRRHRFEVAVLPWGATEAHGLHLPYATDTIAAEAIAERACAGAARAGGRVVLLPGVAYGINNTNLGFPLTMSIRLTTQLAFLSDILFSLEKHRIRKLVIVNGHGGNEFKPLLRELYGKTRVFVCAVDWWKIPADRQAKIFEDLVGDHANQPETSWLLYLKPELVDMKIAGKGRSRKTGIEGFEKHWASFPRPWHFYTKDSGDGNPAGSDSRKGRQFVELAVKRLADFLADLSRRPWSEKFPYA